MLERDFAQRWNPRRVLRDSARKRLTELRESESVDRIDWNLPIVELVPVIYPGLEEPRHLLPYCERLDEAVTQYLRESTMFHGFTAAAPPQHGKTQCAKAALLKAIKTRRNGRHMYVSYSQTRTDTVERELRQDCERLGIKIEGTRENWFIPETKSRIIWTSIGGVGSGVEVNGLLIVDDPFKDYAQARSATERETAYQWLVQVAMRRLHKNAWLVEMATRWHQDDLTQRIIDRLGWEYVNVQGICEDEADGTGRKLGDALFPALHSKEELELQKKAEPIAFEAQYQGRPRAIGDSLFDEPARFIDLPDDSFVTAYGCDLAYSESTAADWSVLLRGRRYGNSVYIIHGLRKQVVITKFLPLMKAVWLQMKGVIRWYRSGTEKGTSGLISVEIPTFNAMTAKDDKVIRSINAQHGWNLKHVLLPDEKSPYYGPWVADLRKVCMMFSGQGDAVDDDVDALAALVDQLMGANFDWESTEKMQEGVAIYPKRGMANAGGWRRT